jgi:hypothetical protein
MLFRHFQAVPRIPHFLLLQLQDHDYGLKIALGSVIVLMKKSRTHSCSSAHSPRLSASYELESDRVPMEQIYMYIVDGAMIPLQNSSLEPTDHRSESDENQVSPNGVDEISESHEDCDLMNFE